MSSSNSNPRRVPIVDIFPNAPIRSRRVGRLRNLGSVRGSSIPLPSSDPSSRTRGSLSQRSSSRGKEPSEPLREPTVEEIVPTKLSFYHDRESLRNQVSGLDRADIYPTQITEGLISVVRRDCHCSSDFPIIIPNPNQIITSYMTGFSFVYTYPFTLGFRPSIDPVILEFYRFFDVCLDQIGPIIWRVVAYLRHLTNKAGVPFTFPRLIHLYSPRLFRNGVFTLVARSKRVLVSPEDKKVCGWYARFVAAPTVGVVGDDNVPFPEKWNFAPTMGVVEDVPNFHNWVDKLLKIVPMDGRSWKTISQRFGWKVKTHGLAIRGVTAEVVTASRISLERAQEIILGSLSKRKVVNDQGSEEEEDGGSLITRSWARRCIISDDEGEASLSHSIPLTESIKAPVVILDDDVAPAAAHDSVEQLFFSGFDGEGLGPVLDEAPLASFSTPVLVTPSLPISVVSVPPQTVFTTSTVPPSTIPPPIIHHAEVGSSSRSGAMRAKLERHSSLTLMNDIVHASLKANLIGTEMMKRVDLSKKLLRDSQLEACYWKEQYESLQIDMEYLEESNNTLEQQGRALTSKLAVEKASSSQADKEMARLETSFSEQLSKASEEIRDLKALLGEKEAYAGELDCALESSHASLQASYTSALTENEKLKNEIADWKRDYEILEDKSAIEVSWEFLNSRRDTLVEASQENFNLESELAKINETIEKAQQTQDFPSPVAEASMNVEVDTGIPTISSPVEHVAASQVEPATVDTPAQVEPIAVDAPALVPSTSQ
ncbi:uncharacterized protein [Nicotiana sylvestris]|uniref:uncharacterized protein n=1 Tax=Nicotiana sylvestris TaxID=4096 RepID=UPI00388C99E8